MNDLRTIGDVLRENGWRWLLASVLVITPVYIWVFFYRLSSGDLNHDTAFIMSYDPTLATFVIPFALAVRVLGWKGWKWPVMALATGFFASVLPHNVAQQLLPGSYITSLIVLVGVTLIIKLMQPVVLPDDAPRYSRSAIILQCLLLAACVSLLLPVTM